LENGLIHIYCGEGKGKTTASLGLIVRSSGAGYKVVIMQCFKGGESSELRILESMPNVKVIHADLYKAYTWELNKAQKEHMIELHELMFQKSIEAVAEIDPSQKVLLVLDEMIGATSYGYIDKDMVLDFLISKPANLEVVLTGRNPLPEFIELADYVSCINKVKHPYDRGINARKGIEF
jgi:cob(I)alamin adenosyltransferase